MKKIYISFIVAIILVLNIKESFSIDRTHIVLDRDELSDEAVYETEPDLFDLDYDPSEYAGGNTFKIWDPWEDVNRSIFEFNKFILIHIGKPFYDEFYVKITTPIMRRSVTNIVENYRLPILFANYLLQLDFENSVKSLASFLMNFTIGVLGFANPARAQGIFPDKTDLGITLAKYNIPAGPFIMIPFFGPNDVRGGLSWAVELIVNPLGTNLIRYGGHENMVPWQVITIKNTFYVVDSLSFAIVNFYDFIETSFDPYIMMRDAYEKSQNYKINKVKGKI